MIFPLIKNELDGHLFGGLPHNPNAPCMEYLPTFTLKIT